MQKKKPLMIKYIDPESNGQNLGIQAGDSIVRINGHRITDIIDYYFYSSDTPLKIEIHKPDNKIMYIRVKDTADLGFSFYPMQFKTCGNNCIFCFIDQNPPGMRKSIYEKDEDYRLSFLYGNYVTLTNTTRDDLKRIVNQRLSPLYISVHAVQQPIRRELLGIKKNDNILKKISFLTDNNIELHAQIVLCPGINDGEILEDTIEKLSGFYPSLKTLAIVPVGLTKHRKNLPRIQPVTKDIADSIVTQVHSMQRNYIKTLGSAFVFLADEFYLLSEKDMPDMDHYGEFRQIDNGVGLTRHFIHDFRQAARKFPESVSHQRKLIFVTGELAGPIIKKYILPLLNRINGINAQVCTVKNKFYGRSVTVSGLLTGVDIINTCKKHTIKGEILLPGNCLNNQDLFLDDLSIKDVRNKLKQNVRIINDVEEIV